MSAINLYIRELQQADKSNGLSLGKQEYIPLKTFLKKAALEFHLDNVAKTYVLVDQGAPSRINVELAIPFDGLGRMEVDLLCVDARIAVEIDGEQHLADANAYRRDRRKDVLLQENGYMVLRFLAIDVGKHLDEVLDSVLRALFRSTKIDGHILKANGF